jgi:hypothetical protein
MLGPLNETKKEIVIALNRGSQPAGLLLAPVTTAAFPFEYLSSGVITKTIATTKDGEDPMEPGRFSVEETAPVNLSRTRKR